MKQINFEMDGYTFFGYVSDNSIWNKDLSTMFHSLEDVSIRDGQAVATFAEIGSPGFAEDGCHYNTCTEPSCIRCLRATRNNCEMIVPFGLGVKLYGHILKKLPELGAIKDTYAKQVKQNRRHLPKKQ